MLLTLVPRRFYPSRPVKGAAASRNLARKTQFTPLDGTLPGFGSLIMKKLYNIPEVKWLMGKQSIIVPRPPLSHQRIETVKFGLAPE